MKILGIALIAALLYSCNSSEHHQPEIKNGDVKIAYNLSGSGDTAIVFVHGWCINKEYWKAQQDFFKDRFTTVALDLGGHGESGRNRKDWTMENFADDVIAVINGLNLRKVILVGHSMSGDINLAVVNKIPDRIIGFVGVDNIKDIVTSFSPEQQAGINNFMESVKNNFDSAATSYTYGALFPHGYKDSASMKRVINDVTHADSSMAIASLGNLVPATLKEAEQLSQLRIPVYLIVSDMSPVNDTAVAKYCKKGLEVKTIKGVGHYPMIEKPAEFNQQLQAVLNEIAKNN